MALMITRPEHRKSQEELEELKRLRMERERERADKWSKEDLRRMHEQSKIINRLQEHNKEIQKQVYLEALQEHEAEKQIKETHQQTESVVIDGASNHTIMEPPPAKHTLRNQRRLKIAKRWYDGLCVTHNNNLELVAEEINGMTNEKTLIELDNLTPQDEKNLNLWANGAERWIKDNGKNIWGFKKTQGGKRKRKLI